MIKVRDGNIKTRVFNNFKGFLQQKLCKSTFTFYLLVSQRKGFQSFQILHLLTWQPLLCHLCQIHSVSILTTQNHVNTGIFSIVFSRIHGAHTINMGQLFKKYTETVFNRILSEYRKIPCQKAPYSQWFRVVHYTKFSSIHCIRTPWIRENTVQKNPVFTVVLCSVFLLL